MWYMKIRVVLSAATAALSLLAARPESSGLVLIYAWDAEDIAITGERLSVH